MTCHGIRRNVRHIRILHLVSNLTISPQSTCHSAPVCKIFIQIGPPSAEKNVKSCRFSRWIPAVLDFRGPVMGSLKIPCTTSYRKSIETIAIQHSQYSMSIETRPLNCLFLRKSRFCIFATDRQTNGQTDGHHRCVKPPSRCRELRLNKRLYATFCTVEANY